MVLAVHPSLPECYLLTEVGDKIGEGPSVVGGVHAAGDSQGCWHEAVLPMCGLGPLCVLCLRIGTQLSEGGVCCFLQDFLLSGNSSGTLPPTRHPGARSGSFQKSREARGGSSVGRYLDM